MLQFTNQLKLNILCCRVFNITEDIWKLISEQVNDGPQFLNINKLKIKLKNVIDDI